MTKEKESEKNGTGLNPVQKIVILQKGAVYKVKVKTTNCLENTCYKEGMLDSSNYIDCDKGVIFIITDDPRKIYTSLGIDIVLSIEKYGVGFAI